MDCVPKVAWPVCSHFSQLAWHQIEHKRLITQLDPHHANGSKIYLPFWEIIKLSLDYTLNRLKVEGMDNVVEDLMRQYASLSPSPENLAMLERLEKQD